MTERYGACGRCGGKGIINSYDQILLRTDKKECPRCSGTGFSGTAVEYLDKEQKKDSIEQERERWEKDRPDGV